MRRTLVVGALAVAGVLAAAGACFSDRETVTGPPAGNAACNIPVNSPIFGSTRALVAIRGFSFQPATIRVQRGTVVTWVNCEPANVDAHTSTSEDDIWSSPFIPPGEIYTRTFSEAGTFDYFCVPHPSMRGVVIVE